MTQAQETNQPNMLNGINLDVVAETMEAVRNDRDLGLSRFKIHNKWNGGTRATTTVGDMYAAKQTIPHKAPHQMQSDEPEMLSGTDMAPNPVEQLLSALASCVVTSIIAHASDRGIEIRSLETEIDGDIDLNGFLGLDDTVPRGYTDIRITLHIDSPHHDLEEIAALSHYSPVFNTITNGAKVHVMAKNSGQ